jgi:hypothetical protein
MEEDALSCLGPELFGRFYCYGSNLISRDEIISPTTHMGEPNINGVLPIGACGLRWLCDNQYMITHNQNKCHRCQIPLHKTCAKEVWNEYLEGFVLECPDRVICASRNEAYEALAKPAKVLVRKGLASLPFRVAPSPSGWLPPLDYGWLPPLDS